MVVMVVAVSKAFATCFHLGLMLGQLETLMSLATLVTSHFSRLLLHRLQLHLADGALQGVLCLGAPESPLRAADLQEGARWRIAKNMQVIVEVYFK